MESLLHLRHHCPGPTKTAAGRWVCELRERTGKAKSQQTLLIEHDGPDFSVYYLDLDWPGRSRPGPRGATHEKSVDGVLVVALAEASVVCFIDLKGKLATDEQADHATAQFRASVAHFAPLQRAQEAAQPVHGDDHHDAWTRRGRRPQQEKLDGHPDRDHLVVGIVVQNRELARIPTTPFTVAGKTVRLYTKRADRRDHPNTARIDARQLVAEALLRRRSG